MFGRGESNLRNYKYSAVPLLQPIVHAIGLLGLYSMLDWIRDAAIWELVVVVASCPRKSKNLVWDHGIVCTGA